jgi:DNA (cytosine-5)-methyltransferase 1
MSSILTNNNKPKVVDLFSGAGGLSLGFCRAGFDVVAWVEKDIHTAETLRCNHTTTETKISPVINKSIEHVMFNDIEARIEQAGSKQLDVLIGGPPCKGFSRSNKRTRTIDNPMNSLYLHYLRFVEFLQPKVVVMENVSDMQSFAGGKVIEDIQNELERMGYRFNVKTLDASNFGVPQVRNRTIIVAHRDNLNFVYPKGNKDAAPTVWDAISDLPEVENGNLHDVLPYSTSPQTDYQRLMRISEPSVANNLVTRNGELVLERYSHIPQGGNWRNIPDNLMTNYTDKLRCHSWIYKRLPENAPSVTLTNFRKSMLIHPREDRGLSVREAARLQSFPDSYIFKGTINSQQQQVADAVPVLMAEAVATEVLKALHYTC